MRDGFGSSRLTFFHEPWSVTLKVLTSTSSVVASGVLWSSGVLELAISERALHSGVVVLISFIITSMLSLSEAAATSFV